MGKGKTKDQGHVGLIDKLTRPVKIGSKKKCKVSGFIKIKTPLREAEGLNQSGCNNFNC
jgi:hypothetical protein